ncbi:MAG: sulfotransferase family 2 domain-containing protein [Gammaproteobacteria bacterium]
MFYLVDNEKKFLIGWSAKSGCTAIKRWYVNARGLGVSNKEVHKVIGYGDTEYTSIDRRPYSLYDEYTKICIIRDPFKRLISGYVNKYVVEEAYKQTWGTFEEFVDVLMKDRWYRRVDRHHFSPQTAEAFKKFVRRGWSWNLVLDIGELNDRIDEINRLTGLSGTLEHPNKTEYRKQESLTKPAYQMSNDEIKATRPGYQYFYNEELVEKVRRRYDSDFVHFESWGITYDDPEIPRL